MLRFFALGSLLFFLATHYIYASETENLRPVSLGRFHQWEAFSLEINDHIKCWMSSADHPKGKAENSENQKYYSAVLHVSMRPHNNVRDEVHFQSVYPAINMTDITLDIDKKQSFALVPQENNAWFFSAIDQGQFIALSRLNRSIKATIKDEKNKEHIKYFSLIGFTKAYDTMFNKCKPYFKHNKSEKENKKEK